MKVPDLKADVKRAQDTGTADFEAAIELTKFGKFHLSLIVIGGIMYLGTGFEYGLHAYVLPFAQCDLKITTSQMGVVNALFLAGSIICSFVWGAVADTIGRRKVIIMSLFMDGIFTVVASMSTSFYMFAAIRFLCGFMIGAPGCLATSYVGEFCVNRHRTRVICLIGFCWTLAWMLLPGVAWLIIPVEALNFSTPFMEVQSWRVLVFVTALPPIFASLCVYFLPETPKFLYVQGKETEAIDVLKKMFRLNTGRPIDEYPIVRLVMIRSSGAKTAAENGAPAIGDAEGGTRKGKSFGEVCSAMVRQTTEIFSSVHIKKTVLCSSIYFANFFGYYGLGMWLPELFKRFEEFYSLYPDRTATVCELSQMYLHANGTRLDDEAALEQMLSDCGERVININVFSNTFIIGAVTCVGNILAIILSNKVGGRLLSVVCNVLAGVSAMAVYYMKSELGTIIVNCLFMMGIGTAMVTISSCMVNLFPTSVRAILVAGVNSAINVHNYCTVNLFPTYIRGMGVCIGMAFGRVGAVTSNLIFGLLLDISCQVPIFFLGGTVVVGGLLCLLLPKNSSQAAE